MKNQNEKWVRNKAGVWIDVSNIGTWITEASRYTSSHDLTAVEWSINGYYKDTKRDDINNRDPLEADTLIGRYSDGDAAQGILDLFMFELVQMDAFDTIDIKEIEDVYYSKNKR